MENMEIISNKKHLINPDYNPLPKFKADDKQEARFEKKGIKAGSSIYIEKEKGLLEYLYVKKTITLPLKGPLDLSEISADYEHVFTEYDTLLKLSNHPNSIKPISFDYERFDTQLLHQFIIKMDYGGIKINERFNQIIKEGNPSMVDEKIIRWAKQSLSILAYAEQLTIKHGDVKLDNLTSDQNDNLHLIDLGSAREYLKSISTRSSDTISTTLKTQDNTVSSQEASHSTEYTSTYCPPEILNKSDMKHPYLSDVYSWAICFYILLNGKRYIKPIEGSEFGQNAEALDTLKKNIKEHQAILIAAGNCSFYGGNKIELNNKFIPIIKACLNFDPKQRMNFLKLNTIMKKFERLSHDEILKLISDFTNPQIQSQIEKSVDDYLTLDNSNAELRKKLNELLNSQEKYKKGWEAILSAFSSIKGFDKVDENNVKNVILDLAQSNIKKGETIENLKNELENVKTFKNEVLKNIDSIFNIWKSMMLAGSISKIDEILQENKKQLIDPIVKAFGLDEFEIPNFKGIKKEEINLPGQKEKLPEMTEEPQKDELVLLGCSNALIFKSTFIEKFAQVNSNLESPFFHHNREHYMCPFCSTIHTSSTLKTIFKGDIALLEAEAINKLSQNPNLRLGKCCECKMEIDQIKKIFISECGHFYHLKCMLKKYTLNLNQTLMCSVPECKCEINKLKIQKCYEKDMFNLEVFECLSCSYPIESKDNFGMMKCLHTYHLDCIVRNKIKDCYVCIRTEIEKRVKENNYKQLTEEEENSYKNLKTYEEALKAKGCVKCFYIEDKYVTLECGHSICPRCISNPRYYDHPFENKDFILYINDQEKVVSSLCEACDPTLMKYFKMIRFNLTCGCKCENYFEMRNKVKLSLVYENYSKFPFTYPKCPSGNHDLNIPDMFFFAGVKEFNDIYEGSYMYLNSCRDYTSKDYSKFTCSVCGKKGEVPLFNCSCTKNQYCFDCIRENKLDEEFYSKECPKCKIGVPTNKFIKICYALSLNPLYKGGLGKFKFIDNFTITETFCCSRKGIKSQEYPNQYYCFKCECTQSYDKATKNYIF